MQYFFIAISTRENLELCKKYALAGFPSTLNGAWTYSEIDEGDFITFLYGARAHNLYKVRKKEAIADAENLPPWEPLRFRMTGKRVYFPFRLYLEPLRELEEPIARPEFYYIAENLLKRGGYEKTHFQADQTTLQNVSQMGKVFRGDIVRLALPSYKTFTPRFLRARKVGPPYIYQFREVILQSLIRKYLSREEVLKEFLELVGLGELVGIEMEALGEKALAEGHVDILLKETRSRGRTRQVIIEVKLGEASKTDMEQLRRYLIEIGEECIAAALIASKFPKRVLGERGIYFLGFRFKGLDLKKPYTFEQLLSAVQIFRAEEGNSSLLSFIPPAGI